MVAIHNDDADVREKKEVENLTSKQQPEQAQEAVSKNKTVENQETPATNNEGNIENETKAAAAENQREETENIMSDNNKEGSTSGTKASAKAEENEADKQNDRPIDSSDDEIEERNHKDKRGTEADTSDENKMKLSQPEHEGQLSDRYYLTGLQYWVYRATEGNRLICVCCHCGTHRSFSSEESFKKSVSHLTLHFTNNLCPNCPSNVKSELEEACRIRQNGSLSTSSFSIEVWSREVPYIDVSTLPGATGAPRKPRVSHTSNNSDSPRSLRTRPAENNGISTRPRRLAASAALVGFSEKNNRFTFSKNGDGDEPEISSAKIRSYIEGDETGDPWMFCDDGFVSILQVYLTVLKYGRASLKKNFEERNKPQRVKRIIRLLNGIEESLERGYDLYELTTALERIRGNRSLYSMADYASEMVIEAEKVVGISQQRVTSSEQALTGPRLLLESDPSKTYVEETAFLYHDPKTTENSFDINEESSDYLEPLPPANPLPFYPQGSHYDKLEHLSFKWSFNEEQRVLLLNFQGLAYEQLSKHDLEFLGCMLERDDITVVSEGLINAEALDSSLWDFATIKSATGQRSHHKFKRFIRSEKHPSLFSETDHMLEGRIGSFIDYLACHEGRSDKVKCSDFFEFSAPTGNTVEVDAQNDVLYMIDFDLPRILPLHNEDFTSSFKLKEILPGGKWCMTNSIAKTARPFMGPNFYVTPGGAYTHFHQDGNGTVDSGHCCFSGYNEVIMLRRLPERHKTEASRFLPNQDSYDPLYKLPHENGQKPDWPNFDTVTSWKEMGYYPSIFILKPGQHVHINKGRLHAFRKLTTETLPEYDCHSKLRQDLLMKNDIRKSPLCVSVAWDWQYIGVTPEGINREVTSSLENQSLVDQRPELKCLAIPKVCLLAIGQNCRAQYNHNKFPMMSKGTDNTKQALPLTEALLSGIASSLMYVLEQNISFIKKAIQRLHSDENDSDGKICLASSSDTSINPLVSTVDPDGNDYFCKLCHRELENVYLHCDGCEELLQRDFNICMDCYDNGRWRKTIDMHGRGLQHATDRTSSVNHTGGFRSKSATTGCCCPTKNSCIVCKKCNACSCDCHSSFTLRRRFYGLDELQDLLMWLESDAVKPVEHAKLTKARLHAAADRRGRGYEAKKAIFADSPTDFPLNKENFARFEEEKSSDQKPEIDQRSATQDDEVHSQQLPSVGIKSTEIHSSSSLNQEENHGDDSQVASLDSRKRKVGTSLNTENKSARTDESVAKNGYSDTPSSTTVHDQRSGGEIEKKGNNGMNKEFENIDGEKYEVDAGQASTNHLDTGEAMVV